VGSSSWFGFSLVVRDEAPFTRADLLGALRENGIEFRPIVTGNFLKNERVLRYFDYEVAGELSNAEFIDARGLFVGNHHVPLEAELELLVRTVSLLSNEPR
jgi:CDP-6-deoxy-D-xylo-4-hexulose-3-dehydrase